MSATGFDKTTRYTSNYYHHEVQKSSPIFKKTLDSMFKSPKEKSDTYKEILVPIKTEMELARERVQKLEKRETEKTIKLPVIKPLCHEMLPKRIRLSRFKGGYTPKLTKEAANLKLKLLDEIFHLSPSYGDVKTEMNEAETPASAWPSKIKKHEMGSFSNNSSFWLNVGKVKPSFLNVEKGSISERSNNSESQLKIVLPGPLNEKSHVNMKTTKTKKEFVEIVTNNNTSERVMVNKLSKDINL